MSDKRHLHHIWRQLRVIKPWYFLVAAVICGGVSVYALRSNNLHMIKLRDKVFQADQSGADVETPLRNLREYVYAHMNTNLNSGNNSIYPPIQLKNSYDRALNAAKATPDPNTQIYTDAQTACEQQFPHGLNESGRIPCIQSYITTHGIQESSLVPASLYEFDFISPRWSPDLAGWSLIATAIFLGLFIIRWASDRWLQAELQD